MYIGVMMSILIQLHFFVAILLFFAVVFFGTTAVFCGFDQKGMEGVINTSCLLGGAVIWSLVGGGGMTTSPYGGTLPGFFAFLLWELVGFVPWLLMCRKKNGRPSFRTGIMGLLAYAAFLWGVIPFVVPTGDGKLFSNGISYLFIFHAVIIELFLVPVFFISACSLFFMKDIPADEKVWMRLAAWLGTGFFLIAGGVALVYGTGGV